MTLIQHNFNNMNWHKPISFKYNMILSRKTFHNFVVVISQLEFILIYIVTLITCEKRWNVSTKDLWTLGNTHNVMINKLYGPQSVTSYGRETNIFICWIGFHLNSLFWHFDNFISFTLVQLHICDAPIILSI